MKWARSQQPSPLSLSARPLVRYVDAEQAVIDVCITLWPSWPEEDMAPLVKGLDVEIEILGDDGFMDEHRSSLDLHDHRDVVRVEVVHPARWWPAGMGDQSLYALTARLWRGDELIGEHSTSIGLTSVRLAQQVPEADLLVNGQACAIQSVVPIDLIDERALLPAAGDSLLIVRGHYGPDILYDAADRAGILLVQCVPLDPDGQPQREVTQHIHRLAGHPSLAGWFVGHQGTLSQPLRDCIHRLDPTRSIFDEVPGPDLG